MKPILFNTEMARAILEDRKTVTRRAVKEPWYIEDAEVSRVSGLVMHRGTNYTHGMPYPDQIYRPGDILYVRETWCDPGGTGYPFLYKADMPMHWDAENTEIGVPVDLKAEDYTWRPSIHMPREAARLFLRVKNVRAERVQDIGADSCAAEGVPLYSGPVENRERYYRNGFAMVWDSTIEPADLGTYGWAANPWVWVIEFERITKEEANGSRKTI